MPLCTGKSSKTVGVVWRFLRGRVIVEQRKHQGHGHFSECSMFRCTTSQMLGEM